MMIALSSRGDWTKTLISMPSRSSHRLSIDYPVFISSVPDEDVGYFNPRINSGFINHRFWFISYLESGSISGFYQVGPGPRLNILLSTAQLVSVSRCYMF